MSWLKSKAALLFALTIFLGAFLLFQIQPILGKFILPWFGGSPAVWTTCILFFQAFLLVGYGYAYASTKFLRVRGQLILHAVLLIGALVLLPVTPSPGWKPVIGIDPTWRILALLTATVGLPYILLASTGPLMQRWFHLQSGGKAPYRLYALSNLGSMLALLTYPIIVEPGLTRNIQTTIWSVSLACYAVLSLACGSTLWGSDSAKQRTERDAGGKSVPVKAEARVLWIILSVIASVLLLATTNKLCQDVVAIPFLWIAPLTLYLLSFIIAFDRPGWYTRPVFGTLYVAGLALICWMGITTTGIPISTSIPAYLITLFAGCMVCHGELYRLRPAPERLTTYYLFIALGGALGGVAVSFVSPALFDDYHEFQIGLFLCAAMFAYLCFSVPISPGKKHPGGFRRILKAASVLGLVALIAILLKGVVITREFTIANGRNFYGTLAVAEYSQDKPRFLHRTLRHGKTLHGLQYLNPQLHYFPTAYYTEKSGMGKGILAFPRQEQRRIGVVGLGVGTIATWGKPGDYFRFYEINPGVKEIADRYFTYLKNCRAAYDVVLADGRLAMESEPPQQFDILILDAFNNDAPPVHLLTKEAFETYRRHLKPDGLIAINVTCHFLNLAPVLLPMAEHFGMRWAYIPDPNAEDEFRRSESNWILMTSDPYLLSHPTILRASYRPPDQTKKIPLWTDEYTSLFSILEW